MQARHGLTRRQLVRHVPDLEQNHSVRELPDVRVSGAGKRNRARLRGGKRSRAGNRLRIVGQRQRDRRPFIERDDTQLLSAGALLREGDPVRPITAGAEAK